MKPIRLKIKGLNSFVEEQEIDFLQLTRGGFFGIFGPTGSGKSTILDGITIALYGDESRNSADFINVGCDEALIGFEFQISGKEIKRYLVQRSYKRDRKTNRPRSGKCSLMDITSVNIIVLEDTVTGVNEKCREIIGLTKEDFTRTVVLPQGKFSEFLKMEGKSRRDMLERLFNLQEYGDLLRNKLKKKLDQEGSRKISLEGEMKGIGEVTQEALNEKIEENRLKKQTFHKESELLEQIIKRYEDNREVHDLQSELVSYVAEKNELEGQKKDFRSKEAGLERHRSANSLLPYITRYENVIQDKANKQAIYRESKQQHEIFKEKRDVCKRQYEISKERQEKELPNLIEKKQRIQQALEEQEKLDGITMMLGKLSEENNTLEKHLSDYQENRTNLQNKIKDLGFLIDNYEKNASALKVDARLKEMVTEGVSVAKERNRLIADRDGLKLTSQRISEELNRHIINEKALLEKKNEVEVKLSEIDKTLQALKANSPGSILDVSAYEAYILEIKQKWEKNQKHTDTIQSKKAQSEILRKNYQNLEQVIHDKGLELEGIVREIDDINKESMAQLLRETLSEGIPCPVCGSTTHQKTALDETEAHQARQLEDLKERKKTEENELRKLENAYHESRLKIEIIDEEVKNLNNELLAIGTDFLNHPVDVEEQRCHLLKEKITDYEKEVKSLEDTSQKLLLESNTLEGQIGMARTNVSNLMDQMNRYESESIQKKHELEKQELHFQKLVTETGLSDFSTQFQEILEKEKEREKLEQILEGAKSERISHLREKEVIDELFHKTANLLSEKKADIKNKEEQAQQLRKDIAKKTEHAEDIKKTKMALEATIQEINNQYKTLTEQYNQYSQELETAMNKYFSIESSLKEVARQAQDEESHLSSKISEHKFADIEEVKRYVLDNQEIENTEREINQYKEKLSKVIGAIEKTESKLNGRNISEENWLQLQTERMDKEIFLDDLKKETTLIEQEVKNMESKFLAYKELQAKVNDIDYRLGILKDLDSLFKGNKFVEFVALERLKYVSREASERLLDITGNQYGLETDGDGRFLIQDNKNGGVLREASTLSGGETFLTSLALALALSAEIQLKGTAPLELFFLDEGFGTLDDHLLDVVMSSLEKIHHDKLKVGIISHVESVKNRVPVKLIVQEAITGESGSKVRIELN